MPTRREIIARIETPLTALYGEREARQIARIVVMELGGLCLTCNTYWDIPNFTGSISRCGKGC